MKKLLLTILLLSSAFAFAQFGPAIIIDDSTASGRTKKVITGDLNNDGFNDIITAQAYDVDQLSYYLNNGDGSFSQNTLFGPSLADPVYITLSDFNNDNWLDVAAVTQTTGEVLVYLNNNGTFSERITVDNSLIFGNALVSGDFDGNGWNDIVAIAQHSIDYYRNVNGTFTKEHILTTATSPNVLECMHIEVADMNNDGHLDLVTSETLGGVIYFNKGAGIFTPLVFTTEGLISRVLHVFDANNDGFKDVAIHLSPGQLNVYLNDGTGAMTFHTTVFTDNAVIKSIESVDMDNDGFLDIYTAFKNKARAYMNNGTGFTPEVIMHEDEEVFITEVAVSDLDNDGIKEYIWAGVNTTIAYQKNTTLDNTIFKTTSVNIYPNPATTTLTIATEDNFEKNIVVYSLLGQEMIKSDNTTIDISGLAKGIYIVEVSEKSTNTKKICKFIKK